MNSSYRRFLFPWTPLSAGIIGLALRSWLLSLADDMGLLPRNHIAELLSILLLAAIMVVCALGVRKGTNREVYARLFPRSSVAAFGNTFAALGLAISAFTLKAGGFLQVLVPVLGVLSGGALVVVAYCRQKGLRPNCSLHIMVCSYLILRIMTCCRNWGAEPQLQLYIFPLLSSLFLLIASYYRAEMDVRNGDCRKYVFFSQVALFCCCLCAIGEDWLFYLAGAVWMATDFCVLPFGKQN